MKVTNEIFELQNKEMGYWLNSNGGCGNCIYWSDKRNHLGLPVGCKNKKAAQVYDDGCRCHVPKLQKVNGEEE